MSIAPSLLIRGARVIDGTGAPWFEADVAVADGRIQAIGHRLPVSDGAQVVDAAGHYLAPGFIDVHTHDDLAQLRDPGRADKAYQGVTTVVTGNCGFSLFPTRARPADVAELNAALHGDLADHETMPACADYHAALTRSPAALNTVAQVGHGSLRAAVMGFTDRAPNASELATMRILLSDALQQGASGLSLGLMYSPSMFAPRDELLALARDVADASALLTVHLRDYSSALPAALDEFLDIVRQAGCKALVSHLQVTGRANWGSMPAALARLEQARAAGIDVSFDMYPYIAGSTSILQLLPPAWLADGSDGVLQRLDDPAERAALQHWLTATDNPQSKVTQIGWDAIWIGDANAPEHADAAGRSLAELARQGGADPFDMLVTLLRASQGRASVILFQQDETDLSCALDHRLHMVGSDSIPRCQGHVHPRVFGAFPRFLRRAAAAQRLEDAVRRVTSQAAQRFGLWDRGLIRPGAVADLVLFTPDLADQASFDSPRQTARGVAWLWVAGQAVLADGAPTGQRPGRPLPSPQRFKDPQ